MCNVHACLLRMLNVNGNVEVKALITVTVLIFKFKEKHNRLHPIHLNIIQHISARVRSMNKIDLFMMNKFD